MTVPGSTLLALPPCSSRRSTHRLRLSMLICHDCYGDGEVGGELVVAGGDPASVLEAAEHALDEIALLVDVRVKGMEALAGRVAWRDRRRPGVGAPACPRAPGPPGAVALFAARRCRARAALRRAAGIGEGGPSRPFNCTERWGDGFCVRLAVDARWDRCQGGGQGAARRHARHRLDLRRDRRPAGALPG